MKEYLCIKYDTQNNEFKIYDVERIPYPPYYLFDVESPFHNDPIAFAYYCKKDDGYTIEEHKKKLIQKQIIKENEIIKKAQDNINKLKELL